MQTFEMTTRSVLSENFKKIREASPNLYKLPDITKAGGGSNGTLGRALKADTGVSIDVVEQLAGVYGLEPWQMLVPTLEVEAGKNGKPLIKGLPSWPFADIDQRRFSNLKQRQQHEIQGVLREWIEKFEAVNENRQSA